MTKINKNKGFTILEVLLVIAAIGILAAIVLVAINPNRQLAQARNLVRQADINAIHKSLEQYLIDNGRYPNNVSSVPGYICNTGIEQTGGSTNCSGRVDLRELVPTYIAGIPKDPQATGINTGYIVSINLDNNKVSLKSELAENKSISINELGIVRDGLVLNLDAGNSASYPGTGTTWFNLSGNGNNGTLVNGVGYSSANGGSLVFDGVNDYVLLPTNFFSYPSLKTLTLSIWFKSGQTSGGTLFGQQDNNNPTFTAGGWVPVIYLQSNGTVRIEPFWTGTSANNIVNSNSLNNNNWYNIVTTFNNGINELYINGSYVSQRVGLSLVGYTTTYYYFVGAGYSGGRSLGGSYFNGNIANFSFYNRALTPVEIQQNYNATRGRFGL